VVEGKLLGSQRPVVVGPGVRDVVVGRGARVVEVEGGIDVDEDASPEVDVVSGAPVVDVTVPSVSPAESFTPSLPWAQPARTTMAKPAMPVRHGELLVIRIAPECHPPSAREIGGAIRADRKFTNGEGMPDSSPQQYGGWMG